jgi:cell division protein FtsI (penicillin-binding protein 3)
MKYLFVFALFVNVSLRAQNATTQTYQWGGKSITKKEWEKKVHDYTTLFVKNYNSDNLKQTRSDIALMEMLTAEQAENGLAVLVDMTTDSIVSKSGFRKKGKGYIIDNSLFNIPIEPGSLIVPMSAAIIMDNYGVTLNDSIDLEAGKTIIDGRVIMDAEKHDIRFASLKQIIAENSNVGIAKMVNNNFKSHNYQLNFTEVINGYVENTNNKLIPNSDNSSIPYNAFGYGSLLTPYQILKFYIRVAQSDASLFKNQATLTQVKSALREVVENGTAKRLFASSKINFAGKTGTVLVASEKNGYANNQFRSQFIGYDNYENPRYVCMVIITCKPKSPNHFGDSVAGPVFKEIMEDALKH